MWKRWRECFLVKHQGLVLTRTSLAQCQPVLLIYTPTPTAPTTSTPWRASGLSMPQLFVFGSDRRLSVCSESVIREIWRGFDQHCFQINVVSDILFRPVHHSQISLLVHVSQLRSVIGHQPGALVRIGRIVWGAELSLLGWFLSLRFVSAPPPPTSCLPFSIVWSVNREQNRASLIVLPLQDLLSVCLCVFVCIRPTIPSVVACGLLSTCFFSETKNQNRHS